MSAAIIVSADEMSFEEYLVAYDGVRAEWVDRRAVPQDAEGAQQSRLRRFLATLLQTWGEEHDAGEAYLAPLPVRLSDTVIREPDVLFIRRANADRILGTHVSGPPDLVVEVAGRTSRVTARGEKWCDYERAGVPEYWLIDPDRKVAEAWRLGSDGWYDPVPLGDSPALCCDALPGMWIRTDWLWQTPLPRLNEVQKAWGLI